MVTPFELHAALTRAEWTGSGYVLDYSRILPEIQASVDAAADATNGVGGGGGDLSSDEDAPPEVSIVSGKLISRSRAAPRAADADGPDGDVTDGVLALRGKFALATTSAGADFLSGRTFRGLERRMGADAPAKVQQGRSGIASGFEGEGEAGADPG